MRTMEEPSSNNPTSWPRSMRTPLPLGPLLLSRDFTLLVSTDLLHLFSLLISSLLFFSLFFLWWWVVFSFYTIEVVALASLLSVRRKRKGRSRWRKCSRHGQLGRHRSESHSDILCLDCDERHWFSTPEESIRKATGHIMN